MTTKSEFMEALEFFNSCDFAWYNRRTGRAVDGIPKEIVKTLEQALRESHALRQDPSDEMINIIAYSVKFSSDNDVRDTAQYGLSSYHCTKIWKAMREQFLKEIENNG